MAGRARTLAVATLVAFPGLLWAWQRAPQSLAPGGFRTIVMAENPDPVRLPTLGVQQNPGRDEHGLPMYYVWAVFPGMPADTIDAWCYEGPYSHFESARSLGDGGVELRHRFALIEARDIRLRVLLQVELADHSGAKNYFLPHLSATSHYMFPGQAWPTRKNPGDEIFPP